MFVKVLKGIGLIITNSVNPEEILQYVEFIWVFTVCQELIHRFPMYKGSIKLDLYRGSSRSAHVLLNKLNLFFKIEFFEKLFQEYISVSNSLDPDSERTLNLSFYVFMPPKELWEAYSKGTVRPSVHQSVRPAFVSGPYLLYSFR